MAFTPYVGGELPTLVDVAKSLDPDGAIADLAELLTQVNPILNDIPMMEANDVLSHRESIRTGIPTPTWRRLNYGVYPTKSAKEQVTDTIGMLEDYGEVDKETADINGNTADFRMQEDYAHLEGMSNTMASTLFYGDTDTNPERFLGLAPRYDVLGTPANKPTAVTNSAYLKHILGAGGTTSSKQTSIWYVVWGRQSVFGIYPKGSKVGLQARDLGEKTLFDNRGGRFQGYRTHYQWKMGLVVKDWRYIVRIANIELADMTDSTAQKALWQAMTLAKYAVPQTNIGRGVFYASPGVNAMLDLAATEKANVNLGWSDAFGKGPVLAFGGIPIRNCNAILETEAVLS